MPGLGIDRGAKTDRRQRRMWQRLARDSGASQSIPAFEGMVPAGGMVMWLSDTAPDGWLLCNGDTIGDTDSAADHEGPQYRELFEIVKGLSNNAGTEDFDGGDTVELPDMTRRIPLGGGGSQVASEAPGTSLGDTGGEEEHQITVGELALHTHTLTQVFKQFVTRQSGTSSTCGTTSAPGLTTDSTGSSEAHNTMPPTLVVNFIVRI